MADAEIVWTGFAFLASAVAGREIGVKAVSGSGALAFSDGQTIFVPQTPDDWMPVAAQAALIAAGSLDIGLVRRLVGRPQALPRYLYLEVLRASRLISHRLPQSFTRRSEIAEPQTASAAGSLSLALGCAWLPPPPVFFGTIRPLAVLRHIVAGEGIAALGRGGERLRGPDRQVRLLDDEEAIEKTAILRLFQNPFAKGGALSDLLAEILGTGKSRGSQDAEAKAGTIGGADIPTGRIERMARRAKAVPMARPAFGLPDFENVAGPRAEAYPEWNVRARHYMPDHVLVEDVDACRDEGAYNLSAILQAPSVGLCRQLAGLGLEHEWIRRQADGSDIDTEALLEYAIALRTGHSPPGLNIYRCRRQTRRDLAVVVALDISGSTAEALPGRETIFHSQIRAVFPLTGALCGLGTMVAMFGFDGQGRRRVRAIRLLGFEERLGGQLAERLSLLEPSGYTRTGAAIRRGTRMLQRAPQPNRLLVLVTDGIPYDQDYERSYADADTRKAIDEARTAGYACLCLSVGADTDAAKLEALFGSAGFLAVESAEEMVGRIRAVCRRALLSASRRRAANSSRVTTEAPVDQHEVSLHTIIQ